MDLIPNSEQQQIIDSSNRFMADQLPISRLQGEGASNAWVDDSTWMQMAGLGWFALGLEEELGGIGCTLAEEVLLLREVGRQIGPLSVMATMISARVAALAGSDAIAQELLNGSSRAGIASAIGTGDELGNTVTGEFQLFDSDGARYVVCITGTHAVLLDTKELPEADFSCCLDPSTTLTQLRLEAVASVCCIEGELAASVYRRALILAAAMQTGQAMACRDMAVEYSKTRIQFDKPIGSFQAVKHRCSNMAVRCDAADSLTVYAAVADVGMKNDAAFAAASAKHIAGDAARKNAADNVQIHGGIGFTAEYDAHLFVKRAHMMELLFGTPAISRQRVLHW